MKREKVFSLIAAVCYTVSAVWLNSMLICGIIVYAGDHSYRIADLVDPESILLLIALNGIAVTLFLKNKLWTAVFAGVFAAAAVLGAVNRFAETGTKAISAILLVLACVAVFFDLVMGSMKKPIVKYIFFVGGALLLAALIVGLSDGRFVLSATVFRFIGTVGSLHLGLWLREDNILSRCRTDE